MPDAARQIRAWCEFRPLARAPRPTANNDLLPQALPVHRHEVALTTPMSTPAQSLPESARALLDYWFADAGDSPARAQAMFPMWFRSTPAQDEELRTRFGALVAPALAGELDDWAATPHGRLALVLVLDQLTRNLHRGAAAAFAGDEKSLGLSLAYLAAVPAGTDVTLSMPEQIFMAMPLEHAEDREVQRMSVAHAQGRLASLAPQWAPLATDVVKYARDHADIVERFGRFPHRNEVLGRPTTDREQQYLDAGAERFGQ